MARPRTDTYPGWMPGLNRKVGPRSITYWTTHRGKYHGLGNDLEAARAALTELRTGIVLPDTIAELLDEFMTYRRQKHLETGIPAADTIKRNNLEVKNLKEPFGKLHIGEFKRAFAWDYLHKYRGLQRMPSANREITLLKTAYEFAIDRGKIEYNPVRGVEMNPEKSRDRYVSHEELISFCNFAIANGHHDAAKRETNTKKDSDTGRRIALACQLSYLTSKAEGQILKIARKTHLTSEGIIFPKRKRGKNVLIEFTGPLKNCVEQLLALPAKAEPMYLVCRADGAGYTTSGFGGQFRKIMAKWVAAAPGRQLFTFHDLRAKAVTRLKEDGRTAKEVTGHQSEKTADNVYDRRSLVRAKAVE